MCYELLLTRYLKVDDWRYHAYVNFLLYLCCFMGFHTHAEGADKLLCLVHPFIHGLAFLIKLLHLLFHDGLKQFQEGKR